MKKWKRFLIVSLCAIFLSTAIISSYGQGLVVKASESGSNERIITAVASWEILAALLSLFAASGIAVNVSNFMPDLPDVDLPSWNPPQSGIEWESGFDVDNAADSLTEELAKNGVSLPDEVLEKFNGYKPGDDEDGDGHPDSPEDPSDPNSWLEWVKSMVKLGKQHKLGVVTSALLGYMAYDYVNNELESQQMLNSSETIKDLFDKYSDEYPCYYVSEFNYWGESVKHYRVVFSSQSSCYYKAYYDGKLNQEHYPLYIPYDYVHFDINTETGYVSEGTSKDSMGIGFYNYVDRQNGYKFWTNYKLLSSSTACKEYAYSSTVINNSDYLKSSSLLNSIKDAIQSGVSKVNPVVSPTINFPSGEQLLEYLGNMLSATTSDLKQQIADNFINHVTTPVTNPSPDNPSPDEPSVEEPLPDEPAPDKPDSSVNDGSNGLPNLVVKGLKTKFPFCIPFDLIMAFKLFEAPAEAPVWKLPLEVATLGIYYELVIDFNEFEQLAVVLRWIELVAFILSLILITRSKLIKG